MSNRITIQRKQTGQSGIANMVARSLSDVPPESKPEKPSIDSIKAELDALIVQAKKDGDYNVDSPRIRKILELNRQMLELWPKS